MLIYNLPVKNIILWILRFYPGIHKKYFGFFDKNAPPHSNKFQSKILEQTLAIMIIINRLIEHYQKICNWFAKFFF